MLASEQSVAKCVPSGIDERRIGIESVGFADHKLDAARAKCQPEVRQSGQVDGNGRLGAMPQPPRAENFIRGCELAAAGCLLEYRLAIHVEKFRRWNETQLVGQVRCGLSYATRSRRIDRASSRAINSSDR